MAECGQRLQPTTLAPRLLRERQNCGWYLGNLPPKRFIRRNRLTCQGFLNSRHWVFVKEDNFRKDCPPHQSPKDAFLPLIHRGAPSATPEKRQSTLLKGATLLSKLSKAGKAFLEDVEAEAAQHPLTLYPQLTEALPAELLLQVLEVLDPERKLEDVWAYCQDTRKPMKEPTELVGKRSSQERPPKKTLISRSGQWLCEEKSSKVDSLYKDRLLHDDVHRGVTDFCHWAEDLGSSAIEEEFVLQQFDIGYQTRRSCDALLRLRLNQDKLFINRPPSLREHCGHWSEPRSSGRANPQKPKRVKMRYGAWYLNTSLWKRQRADEPLVDPMVSHKAQDSTFKEQLQEQFLEKIYAEEKNKSENIKAPKKLTQTEKNPGSR
ncbi:protein FAM47E isoform X1 [Mus musculus]|uniref:protein FAM47E isoform X1 n=1 Tax=Mus musculus TaxID=10090 RepID=UPI0000428B7F|nr:protein FAM47E isoform X1 [Mus musculus]|eukprot:XP_011247799.1 PREDICTED: protein FAM47E isoform X2 [Mus musculus]